VRRSRTLALGALAVIGVLPPSSTAEARRDSGPASAARITHLQVTQVEYRLLLSRGTVNAGPVSLEAIDRGMDPHDMRLHRVGSRTQIITPELTSDSAGTGS
jgi:hypothetical protein